MNIHASSGLRTKKETTLVRNERAHEQGWQERFIGFWFIGLLSIKTKGLGLYGLLFKLLVIYYYSKY